MGVGPERNRGPLPLTRHKQEVNISNESRAHDPLLSSPGEEKKRERKHRLKKICQERKKKDPCLKIPQKMIGKKKKNGEEKKQKNYKILPEKKDPKNPPTV